MKLTIMTRECLVLVNRSLGMPFGETQSHAINNTNIQTVSSSHRHSLDSSLLQHCRGNTAMPSSMNDR